MIFATPLGTPLGSEATVQQLQVAMRELYNWTDIARYDPTRVDGKIDVWFTESVASVMGDLIKEVAGKVPGLRDLSELDFILDLLTSRAAIAGLWFTREDWIKRKIDDLSESLSSLVTGIFGLLSEIVTDLRLRETGGPIPLAKVIEAVKFYLGIGPHPVPAKRPPVEEEVVPSGVPVEEEVPEVPFVPAIRYSVSTFAVFDPVIGMYRILEPLS